MIEFKIIRRSLVRKMGENNALCLPLIIRVEEAGPSIAKKNFS